MLMSEDDRILGAAEEIRGRLRELLGDSVGKEVEERLDSLLKRAAAGEPVANQILALLGRYEPARLWVARRIAGKWPEGPREDDDADAGGDIDGGEKFWPGPLAAPSFDVEMDEPAEADGGDAGGEASPRPRRRPRVVSTGFARPGVAIDRLRRDRPLAADTAYDFWLSVGRPDPGSIEEEERELLPEQTLEAGARFDVVVQPFDDGLMIDEAARIGELALAKDGRFLVRRQPTAPAGDGDRANANGKPEQRLRFPVRTRPTVGPQRLRCSIYFRNTLVQSRIVTAHVGRPPARGFALSARVDVSLAHLAAAELAPKQPHVLSVLANSNGGSTHSFRFMGAADGPHAAPVVTEAVLLENALMTLIAQARGSMRTVAWGSTGPWTDAAKYRYTQGGPADLATDIFELVREGRHLYDSLINQLAGGPDAASLLRERMVAPGRVQIVSHGSPAELIPASLIYDYVNAAPELGGLKLCPQFDEDRNGDGLLEDSECFKGACPSREEPQFVCPSGFWGFRHALGMPVVVNFVPPPPTELPFRGTIGLDVAVYPEFDLWQSHRTALEKLGPRWSLAVADTYDATIASLHQRREIVYFYCHGGETVADVPYMLVGPKGSAPLIRPALRWDDADRYRNPRSLVILNGCETTALEPDRAIDFVTSFVENIGAVGVIGTEITVFEELASAFGASLLEYIGTGIEVGEAVRRARLSLLKKGNPLGLVYLPMVQSDVRFVAAN
jgi:hypothetical protein